MKLFQQLFAFSLALLFSACSITKNISNQPPYNQLIGKKFVIKEDMYIFKDDDASLYTIAPQDSGINNLPRFIDPKYIGRHIHSLTVITIVPKGSVFSIIKVIDAIGFETSFTEVLIAFDNVPSIKNGIVTSEILNWKNYPYTKIWGDPPIFEAKLVEPLQSDGVWWK